MIIFIPIVFEKYKYKNNRDEKILIYFCSKYSTTKQKVSIYNETPSGRASKQWSGKNTIKTGRISKMNQFISEIYEKR